MKIFSIFILLFVCSMYAYSQQTYQDVVYLKNGSIIRGRIIENIPNVSIKLENSEKTVFFLKMDVIEKITKEPVLNTAYPSNAGYGGNSSNSNYIQPSTNNYYAQPSYNNNNNSNSNSYRAPLKT